MDIQFKMPVSIVMQENCVEESGAAISACGSRAIVVADAQGTDSGALRDVTGVLGKEKITFSTVTVDRYMTPAELGDFARENRRFGAELVISAGGELAVNAGKALSMLLAQDDRTAGFAPGEMSSLSLPHIAVPTTARAGNEVTPLLTFRGGSGELCLFSDPALFARLALLDYRYTAAIPWEATAHGVFSTVACAIEAVLSGKSSKFIRAIAWESLSNTSAVLLALEEDLVDIGSRRMMMYDSVLAGIAISQTQASGLRGISRLLTRDRGMPQGKAEGLLLAPYLHFVWRQKPHLIDMILHSMGFQNLDDFSKKAALLLSNKEVFSAAEIERWAAEAAALPDVANCVAALSERDIAQILRMI